MQQGTIYSIGERTFSASCGVLSPTADSNDARWIIVVTLLLSTRFFKLSKSVTSRALVSTVAGRRSVAITFLSPYVERRRGTSSIPICVVFVNVNFH